MGFLACVVCSMALLLIVNRQQEETAAVHPAQDILDNLASWHQKGKYTDDAIESFVFSTRYNSSIPFDIKGYFVENEIYCF